MSHRIKAVPSLIIGIAGLLASVATAQPPDNLGTPPVQLVVPPPAQPASAGKPQLVFETMEHDFGKIKDDKEIVYNFKFVNKGDGVLKFYDVKASCGCTAGKPRSPKNPEVDQMEFAPGEEGFINAKFNPHGKHGDQNQRITLTTNDPSQPEQVVKFHAFVRTTISFDPPLVSFGEVRAGDTAKQIVKVTGPNTDFKVGYASVSKGRYITVKVLDTKPVNVEGEDVAQSTLELTFNGAAPRGTLQAISTIRTNLATHPLADLQVMAEVVGDIQVLPPRVNVGLIDQGADFKRVFKVSSRSGKPFKILGVDQKSQLPSPLTVNVTPVEAGNETAYNVEILGKGPNAMVPVAATLMIKTDSTSDKTIEVSVSGAVRPPSPVPPAPATQLQADPGQMGPGGSKPAPVRDDKP